MTQTPRLHQTSFFRGDVRHTLLTNAEPGTPCTSGAHNLPADAEYLMTYIHNGYIETGAQPICRGCFDNLGVPS